MKKLSIVLLALLLVGGMAFAAELALSGEVSANFGLDFDNEEYGFYQDNTNEIDLSFTASSSSVGEGDVYAEIVVDGASIDMDTHSDDDDAVTWSGSLGDLSATVYAGDLSVALSSTSSFGNAAAVDMDDDDDTDVEDTVAPDFGAGTGITVNYMDASIGVDYWSDADDSDDNDGTGAAEDWFMVYGGYAMDLTEELSVGVDAAYADEAFYGSLTAAYAMDDYSVSAAMDMAYASSAFDWDAALAASATVADVTAAVDVYFDGDVDVKGSVSYAGVENLSLSVGGYINDSFTAQAVVDEVEAADAYYAWVDADDDETTAPVWQQVAAVAAVSAVDEELKEWSVSFDAAYDVTEALAPYVSLGYGYDGTDSVLSAEVGVDVAMIDNAAVNVNYANSDLANNKGAVNASVTVSL